MRAMYTMEAAPWQYLGRGTVRRAPWRQSEEGGTVAALRQYHEGGTVGQAVCVPIPSCRIPRWGRWSRPPL